MSGNFIRLAIPQSFRMLFRIPFHMPFRINPQGHSAFYIHRYLTVQFLNWSDKATSVHCVCDTCNTHKTLDNTKHIIYIDFDRCPFI